MVNGAMPEEHLSPAYFLRHDESSAVRLYLLDRPSDRRFWRPWTKQEIEASERVASEPRAIFEPLTKKAGEGCFLPDAYRPEHRRQRFMGELPHQWMEIYGTCECGQFVEWWIKFATASPANSVLSHQRTPPDSSMMLANWTCSHDLAEL